MNWWRVFEDAQRALREQIERWSRPGKFVISDTSFYITDPKKLEDIDLATHLGISEDPIHLLVPMIVVDELDGLKRCSDKQVRWRASHTLAVLDDRLKDPNRPATLRAADFSALDLNTGGVPRGVITIEILFDPPGHVRLPINDDEIIDRAVATQSLADRPITILTYDTRQSMRARHAGLKTAKLLIDPGPEPERR